MIDSGMFGEHDSKCRIKQGDPTMMKTSRSILGSRIAVGFAALVVSGLIAAGCGGGGKSTSVGTELAKKQEFTVNVTSEPATLDPSAMGDLDSSNIAVNLFAGLYRLVGDDNELKPFLADGMPEITDDGLTYTVKLRKDAKWSNGDPVTAEDVVFAVRRALDPEIGAYFATFMYGIKGACEYNTSGPLGDGEKEGDDEAQCEGFKTDRKPESIGVSAVDDHTVKFELETQVPWFDQLLAVNTFWPLHEETIEKHGEKWTEPGNIVTSGPFHMTGWTHRKEITLERSKTFWGKDDVKLTKIRMAMVSDAQTAARQFEVGKLDAGTIRNMVAAADVDKWKTRDEYVTIPSTSTNYIYLNTQNKELSDPKVRQGIALAVNRKEIVEQITKRGDTPLSTIVPTTIPGFETIKQESQDFIGADEEPDVDEAKELLKQGGWNDGDELSVYFTTEGGNSQAVAEQIKSDLDKVGVTLKLVPLPSGDSLYAPGVGTSPIEEKVDMVLLGWAADYLDAQDWYQLWTCDAIDHGLNPSMFCNEEYDDIYGEALKTVDQDARFELYQQLEAMLTGPDGEMPAVPLYQPTDDNLVQKWVKGYDIGPAGITYFDTISILEH